MSMTPRMLASLKLMSVTLRLGLLLALAEMVRLSYPVFAQGGGTVPPASSSEGSRPPITAGTTSAGVITDARTPVLCVFTGFPLSVPVSNTLRYNNQLLPFCCKSCPRIFTALTPSKKKAVYDLWRLRTRRQELDAKVKVARVKLAEVEAGLQKVDADIVALGDPMDK